jgi:hypothetical protein
MAEWWDTDEKIHKEDTFGIWWMTTQRNGRRACPDLLWGVTFSGGMIGTYSAIKTLHKTIGFNMDISYLAKAGLSAEKELAATMLGVTYCGSAYVAGGLDALYQVHHDGRHVLSDKWDYDVQSVTNFFVSGYNKFQHDSHKIQFLLESASEWWRT